MLFVFLSKDISGYQRYFWLSKIFLVIKDISGNHLSQKILTAL